jgi:sugar transferase (PEP-CTERM system associated)
MFGREHSSRHLFILASDGAVVFLTALLSAWLRLSFDVFDVSDYDPYFLRTGVLTASYLAGFYYFDLYTPELFRPGRYMAVRLVEATAVATVALLSLFYMVPELKTWRGILFINIFLLPAVFLAWRLVFSSFLSKGLPVKRVLIIGTGELAKKIGAEIYGWGGEGYKLVGFIDDDPAKQGVSIINPGVIGGYGDIKRVVGSDRIDTIIVALPDRRAKLPMSALLDCKLGGASVVEGETFDERVSGKIPLDNLKPSWMVFSDGFKSLRSRKILKRALDVALSMSMLVVLAPFLLLVALLVRLDSRGPVIFRQTRVGENGREFDIYKFRSLKHDAEAKTGPVWLRPQDDRVTRLGRVMRPFRIDELPQLANVIRGDMSFVGPRPERPFFVNKLREVIPYYEMRTVVKPGITGWAQIKYPYGATVKDALEKLQYDIYYIKNMSPFLDMLIIFWTIKVVLTSRGGR